MIPKITLFGVTDLTARCLELLVARTDCTVERLVRPSNQSPRADITSFLAQTAERLGIDVVPDDAMNGTGGTLGISVGYPEILRPEVISSFDRGIVNLHLAPLPRYRGSLRTLSAAILAGESSFGVTLHEMDSGIDTGPILRLREMPIPEYATAMEVMPALLEEAYTLFSESLDDLVSGTITPVSQEHLTSSKYRLVTRNQFDRLYDIKLSLTADELESRRRALTWSAEDRPRIRTSDGVEVEARPLLGRFGVHRDHPSPGGLSMAVSGECDRYYDPVWRVEVTLSDLERELLLHPSLRRLGDIAHAGAASLMSPQTYSRLEHSLGLLALVSRLRPDDEIMRVSALVHDIGHLPLSHTLESTLGVSHHDLGDAKIRALQPLFSRHGLDAEDILASVKGQGPSALGLDNGYMKLDHFESYVRSAHVHGATWEPPRDTLASIELIDGSVSCSAESAAYLIALMRGEAERQSHRHNARANAVTAWLVQCALDGEDPRTPTDISVMIDRDVWAWLESAPETSEATRVLLRYPEQWPAHAVDEPTRDPGVLNYVLPRLYLDPPLVDGRPKAWPPRDVAIVQNLPRRFTVQRPTELAHPLPGPWPFETTD